jgi:hypothetical protein
VIRFGRVPPADATAACSALRLVVGREFDSEFGRDVGMLRRERPEKRPPRFRGYRLKLRN